jgi:hypothetical protein
MLILPELIIKKLLDELLEEVKSDYNGKVDKTETFLYRIFNGNTIGDFDFYDQVVKMLIVTDNKRNSLETRMLFDKSRGHAPTIHIVLPSESEGKTNAIGMGRDDRDILENSSGSLQFEYSRSFATKYNLAITASNPYEVLIVYNLLKAILIASADSLEAAGLHVPSYTGNDVNMDRSIMPNTYMRAMAINLDYEVTVPSFLTIQTGENLDFNTASIE